MNAQLTAFITALLSLGAVFLPDHQAVVKLSQHSAEVVQIVGALGSLCSSAGLFIAKPHPQARAAAIAIAHRVRAVIVLVWDILRGRTA